MSGNDFGGVMKLRDSAGRNVSLRGTFSVMPGNRSAEALTNQDGSVDRVFTPEAPAAEIVFADKNVDLAALIGDERRNITIVEDHTGVAHLFTDAFYTGRPSTNRLNGEVSGAGIAASSYQRL